MNKVILKCYGRTTMKPSLAMSGEADLPLYTMKIHARMNKAPAYSRNHPTKNK